MIIPARPGRRAKITGCGLTARVGRAAHLHVPEIAFIVGWAIVIVAVGAWGARTNRRWVVTTAAVFGAIEFYTQWFERRGAEPWAIIVAGLTIVAFAIALWRYNLDRGRPATFAA